MKMTLPPCRYRRGSEFEDFSIVIHHHVSLMLSRPNKDAPKQPPPPYLNC